MKAHAVAEKLRQKVLEGLGDRQVVIRTSSGDLERITKISQTVYENNTIIVIDSDYEERE